MNCRDESNLNLSVEKKHDANIKNHKADDEEDHDDDDDEDEYEDVNMRYADSWPCFGKVCQSPTKICFG